MSEAKTCRRTIMILTGLIAQFLVIKKRRLEEERLEEEINE